MSTLRRPVVAAALSISCLLGPLAAQELEPPPFAETIDVREVEVLFDDSVLPRFGSIGRKGLEDYSAFEAGAGFPLVEIGSTTAADWVHLLYFDSALAGPASRAAAAQALAKRAPVLVAGGRVEVVVADPRPRLLTATGDAVTLALQLSEIAAAALAEAESRAFSKASIAERSFQLDRLSVEIAGRSGGGPRALWLAVEGWPLSPEEHERFARARAAAEAETAHRANAASAASEPLLRALAETARVLAGYGWVTFPLALRPEVEEPSTRAAERRVRVESGGAGDERTSFPVFTVSGSPGRADASTDAQLSTLTDLSLAPLALLSRASSGTLVGQEARLRSALDDVVRRRRATYRGPLPPPGALAPVEIRWTGGDGRALPSPGFLRSSTPAEVSSARLRTLLAGDAAPTAAITLREGESAGGARSVCFGPGDEKRVRISYATTSPEGAIAVSASEPLTLKAENGELCAPFSAPADAAGARVAWLAEDLDSEAWTGGIVDRSQS